MFIYISEYHKDLYTNFNSVHVYLQDDLYKSAIQTVIQQTLFLSILHVRPANSKKKKKKKKKKRSACTSAQAHQCLCCTLKDTRDHWLTTECPTKILNRLCVDAQADLNLRWAHLQSCRKWLSRLSFYYFILSQSLLPLFVQFHLDLRCLTFSLSSFRINVFSSVC